MTAWFPLSERERQLYKYRSRKGWIFFFLHQSRLLQRLIQLVPWFDIANEPTNDIHTCTGQQTSHVCDCHSVPDLSKSLLVRLLDPAVQVNSSYYTEEASLAHRPSVNLHAPVIWMTQVNQGRSTTCVSLISGTPSCCHSAAVYKTFYASIFSSVFSKSSNSFLSRSLFIIVLYYTFRVEKTEIVTKSYTWC